MQDFKQLNDQETREFAERFLGEYIQQRGFGAMNKTDIEVLVYHLLRQTSYFNNCKSINDVSMKLKVTRSKVKRLDYEARLRYGQVDEEALMKQAIQCLTKAQFSNDGKYIKFAVEDELLRNFISAKFYELNSFNEVGNNRDIISVDIRFFAQFLTVYVYKNVDEPELQEFFQITEALKANDAPDVQKQFCVVKQNDKPSRLVVNLAYILERVAKGTTEGAVAGAIGSTTGIFTSIGKLVDFGREIMQKISK